MTAPTVVQLRAFAAVARHRHFGAAADDLEVTQPAISAAVAALEASLGTKLFERTHRGALLTTAGAQLVAPARQLLATLDELVGRASSAGLPHHGSLRLGVIPTVAPYLLPTALRTLETAFPELEPTITESTTRSLLASLDDGALDLALVALPSGADELVELPLYWEEFVLLLPEEHRLAGATGLPTTALQGLDILLLEEGHCLRDQAIDLCRSAGAPVGQAAKASSLTTVAQLVAARLGVTLLPATAVPVEVRGPLATARFAGAPLPGRRVGLVHRRSTTKGGEYAELAAVLRGAVAAAGLPVTVEEPEGAGAVARP